MTLPAQEEPITFLDSSHFHDPWSTVQASRHCVLHNCLGVSPHLYHVCLPMSPQAKECLGAAEAGKGKKGAFYYRFWREHCLDNTLVLDFWPLVLWDNFLLF